MLQKRTLVILISAIVLFVLMHIRIFPLDLIGFHVWRQTQTQTVIDNFYEEDPNILHPRINARGDGTGIYRTDFPLMQWIIAGVYHITGNSVLVTRIMMCLFSVLGMLFLYGFLQQRFKSENTALAAAIMYVFTPMMYYYGMVPLVDVFALMLTMAGLWLWYRFYEQQQLADFIGVVFMFIVAAMIKTPFILYLAGLGVFVFIRLYNKTYSLKSTITYCLIAVVISTPGLIWIYTVLRDMSDINNPVVGGVFSADALTPGKYLSYLQFYVVSLLPGVLTGYISFIVFVIGLLYVAKRVRRFTAFGMSMLIVCALLICYVLYEAPAMHTAHDYYFMPFLPIIFLVVAFGAQQLVQSHIRYRKHILILIVALSPLIAFTRMDARWNENKPGFNKDLYVHHEEIQKCIPDGALVVCGNDESKYIWPYYLEAKGWTFKENKLTDSLLQDYHNRGAQLLITDMADSSLLQILSPEKLQAAARFGTIKVIDVK